MSSNFVEQRPEDTMISEYQSKYLAAQLTLQEPAGSIGQLSRSISNARVDLNPHQVDAALFAVRSPLSKGVVLADEVGLGKTIEAGLVLAQRWAERRRKILIIVPASLRTQWARELDEKFNIPSMVLESRSFKKLTQAGNQNPFVQDDCIVICSYHFAANKSEAVSMQPWDLVVIDEAHRLRNVYKTANKMARKLRDTLFSSTKVLLTATPLQNSLMELYGIVSFIDPHVFGDESSFREQFARAENEEARNLELRSRLAPVCHRTLRRQVLEYIKFTKRIPLTWEFHPTQEEQQLYDQVSAYLQRDELFALPSGQRKLMTMVLRKLLASSSFAIAATLRGLIARLAEQAADRAQEVSDSVVADFETYDETSEEWTGDEESSSEPEANQIEAEIANLKGYLTLAESIQHNAKGSALLDALGAAFPKVSDLGGVKKAVVFTESKRTQSYIYNLLESSGYAGQVAILNGTNNDQRSKDLYSEWKLRHEGDNRISGSRPVDVKAAIIEEFRERATILIATEAAAEGLNMQFCSLVVNYDLPWNPQRIEQRIGRCHRYGQKHDVVVVNFLNKKNAADQRVYELLAEKFHLFDGVFGSSDEVLGALESGVDVEQRIAEIYQECRTEIEIEGAFLKLQSELDEQIAARLAETRQVVLDHFDKDVQERLRVHRDEARAALDTRGRLLLALTRAELRETAEFDEALPRFKYREHGAERKGLYNLDWKSAEERGEEFFRTDHPLALEIINRALERTLEEAEISFDYYSYGAPVAILADRLGQSGWLRVSKITVKSISSEEHLVVSGVVISEDGAVDALDSEWCQRLLELPIHSVKPVSLDIDADKLLDGLLAEQHASKLELIEHRNGAYFEEEVEKLDHWAEDLKLTLERELKEFDAEIRAARKEAKTKLVLADKLEAQRRIKKLEQRRSNKRRQLFEAQDDVDTRRSELIEGVELQLKTSAERETLFTIRWALPVSAKGSE